MKEYESVPKTRLTRRVPVMMRLDGKAFHTFTRGLPRPYCRWFHCCMWEAARYLCENIQGAQLAYVQSDEISILLTDYLNIKTEAWYDYQVQKMCSVAAAMCSVAFMRQYMRQYMIYMDNGFISDPNHADDDDIHGLVMPFGKLDGMSLPAFDCRVWNLPKEEIVNGFIWRQQDATRNAIQMAGQSQFSHKELHGKSCDEIQEMLFQGRSINFNDYPVPQKRGVCIVKRDYQLNCPIGSEKWVKRSYWEVDEGIPIFTEDRSYIERHV